MSNYLLLRDNKEAGPFTLDELLRLGLKPYDLVWISGKSAAWRYPSEVAELKAYAPEVEEQPFDRFFKKPGSVKVDQSPVTDPEPVVAEAYQPYAPKIAVAEQPVKMRRSVFVTLPGEQVEKKVVPKPAPVQAVKPVPVPIPDYTAEDNEEIVTITENPVAKIKYSQPLDEIKEMYVKTLKERKDKIARKSFLKVGLKRAAVVAALIGIGVLAGFIIRSKPGNNNLSQLSSPAPSTALAANTPSDAEELSAEPIETTPTPLKDQSAQNLIVQPPTVAMSESLPSKKEEAKSLSNIKRPAAMMPAPQGKNEPEEQQEYVATEKNVATGERTRTVRSAQQERNESKAVPLEAKSGAAAPSGESPLAGLGNQVSVSSNDYKRVALGGIRNLELTVTNRSKFSLDQVMVELQYLKPSEQPVKTELIQFKAIPANESATIRIPDTNRGVKVQFKIVRIGSREGNAVAGN